MGFSKCFFQILQTLLLFNCSYVNWFKITNFYSKVNQQKTTEKLKTEFEEKPGVHILKIFNIFFNLKELKTSWT